MRIAFLTDNIMGDRSSLDPFRSELIKEFSHRATEFLVLQCNDFFVYEGEFEGGKSRRLVLKAIAQFKPQLVFSLNRAGLVAEVLANINCPVVTWYIDNPSRFPKAIRTPSSKERVFIASRSQFLLDSMRLDLKDPTFEWGYLPFCTNGKVFHPSEAPTSSPDMCDVSFVGTLWDPTGFINRVLSGVRTQSELSFLLDAYSRYLQDYSLDLYKHFKSHGSALFRDYSPGQMKSVFDDFISSQRRLQVLDALCDLKLEVYGNVTWAGYGLLRSEALLRCFRVEAISSPESLASLYRRSKVGLSVAHHQAQCGFPIRIFDLLGSGVPVVTDRHSELDELFEEGKTFLSYETPEEARQQVCRILGDPALAKSMRLAGVEAVREKHSFTKRVDEIVGGLPEVETRSIIFVSDFLDPGFLFEECGRTAASTKFVRYALNFRPVIKSPPENSNVAIAKSAAKKGQKAFGMLGAFVISFCSWPILSFRLVFKATMASTSELHRRDTLAVVKDLGRGLIFSIVQVTREVNIELRRRLNKTFDEPNSAAGPDVKDISVKP